MKKPGKASDDFGGLDRDLRELAGRRRVLRLLGGASLIPIFGCGGESQQSPSNPSASSSSSSSSSSAGGTSSSSGGGTSTSGAPGGGGGGTCAKIPEETAGPFPGDGTIGGNALTASGIVRNDITASFGASTTKAQGVPLTMKFKVVNTKASCAPLAGAAVYVWHCDRDGNYSMYTAAVANENYLRGVAVADANGDVTFTTIFPGCYPGRWPHVHFEIFASVDKATSAANIIATSQLAFTKESCDAAYAQAGYQSSVTALSQLTLAGDGVFADGATLQVATMSGDAASGFTSSLVVGVAGS